MFLGTVVVPKSLHYKDAILLACDGRAACGSMFPNVPPQNEAEAGSEEDVGADWTHARSFLGILYRRGSMEHAKAIETDCRPDRPLHARSL